MGHFNWAIDGSIVGVYLVLTMVAGLWVRKYVGKVEQFLVAGREMDLYLGIASLAATEFGIITCMYAAQNGHDFGFSGATVGILFALSMFFVGKTGFCIKPLRDSGVMTIPELFQHRFGSKVRWLAGVVIVLGGLLNMGVFLRMGGDFLVNTCGLDQNYLVLTMTVLLVGVAVYTILGGMLSVLVTDYLQFVVMSIGLIAVTVLVLSKVHWTGLVHTVQVHYGAGGFNPFLNPNMGWPYVAFNAVQNLAAVLTWQTTVARVLAAKDSKTGQKVYTGTSFFFVCRFIIPGIWGIAALAAGVTLGAHESTNLAMPRYLSQIVPVGLMGLVIAAMLAADMSTDSSYMLTWASVIYNDIMGPFRKTPWSQKKGLVVNRAIVAGIGLFLLVFGLWLPTPHNMWNYISVTGAIYLSSMGILLVACCYWKRANNWGATAAIIVGAIIPLVQLILDLFQGVKDWMTTNIGLNYPSYFGLAAFVAAGLAMVIGSLLKPGGAEPIPSAKVDLEVVR